MSKSSEVPGLYICDLCGKKFVMVSGHLYKLHYNHHIRHFCGYTCYRKVQVLLESKNFLELNKLFEVQNEDNKEHQSI